jgi:hypothetical protein
MRATVLIAILTLTAAGPLRAAGMDCLADNRGAGAPIAAVPRAEFYDPLPRPSPTVTKELPAVGDRHENSEPGDAPRDARPASEASGSSSGADPRRSRAGATPTQRGWRDVLPGQLKFP